MRIGITERGDPSIDYSWKDKIGNMDGTVIITKNLTDKLIDEVKPYINKVIFHITCTGYGGTVVEPNIPKPETQLSQAKKLLNMGVHPTKVVIRIDPIIPTDKGIKRAKIVFEAAIKMGFKRFRISVIDMYPHVRERFKENGLPLPYGTYFSASDEQMMKVNQMIKEIKTAYPGTIIESCAEGKLTETDKVGCISDRDLFILGLDISKANNFGYQRKGCLCCSAKTELLSEKKQCPYKCLYCYWKD